MPNISIIIVSWKVKDLLEKCLLSIFSAQGDLVLEVFVVDNNSGDGTVEMIKEKFPKVKLIASQTNLGFSKANNLALKQATGEYVLILNPDTVLQPNTLTKSLEFFKRQPQAGALGSKMLYPDGRTQPSIRRLPTFWPIFLMLIKAPKLFANLKAINYYLAKDFDYGREQKVKQIMGAFMFVPKNILDEVGYFDERFFIWFEEVDLCRRLAAAGYEIWYSPAVVIIHYGGQSFAQAAIIRNQRIFFISAFKYFWKYFK